MKGSSIFVAQLAFAAILVFGSPVTDSADVLQARDYHVERRDGQETHIFKRDAAITERDIELAELHSVNLTQMFKHSVHKRSDGDDFTIWVSNSYSDVSSVATDQDSEDEDDDESDDFGTLDERAMAAKPLKLRKKILPWKLAPGARSCPKSSYTDISTSSSPYTGGVKEMRNWCKRNGGGWSIPAFDTKEYDLLIGGSNNGANAVFAANRISKSKHIPLTTSDVHMVINEAHNRYARKFGGAWRVSAKGQFNCDQAHPGFGSPKVGWRIGWTSQNPF